MRGSHHPLLVVLAVFVGVIAAFVAIDLFAHGRSARGGSRRAWLVGGVVATALGIWSVHFIGMLSLRLRLGAGLVPVGYHLLRMLVPIGVAAGATALAAATVGRFGAGLLARVGAGLLLGAAIVGAHYSAMASMRVAARVTYSLPLVGASLAVAAAGAVAVLTAVVRHVEGARRRVPQHLGAALLAGAVVAGTHYTAIAAARFAPTGRPMAIEATELIATNGVATFVATVVLMILGFALLSVTLDRRAREQLRQAETFAQLYHDADATRTAVEESERRFRMLADTAPAMVWLSGPDGRRTYVGQKWHDFTGRPADAVQADATGADPWVDAMHPEDRAACLAKYRAALDARRPFRLEYRVLRPDGTACWGLDTGVPRHAAGGEFVGYVGTCVDITDRREAEETQRFLLEAARVLATSLDFDAVLRRVTQLLVPRVADYCVVHFRAPDGSYPQVTSAHVDPAKAPLLEELGRRYQPRLEDPHSLVARALTTARPVLHAVVSGEEARSIGHDAESLRLYRELAPASYVVVPLVARGERLGTITLVMSVSGRQYAEKDRATAELFAARAALALDNARLYTEALRARDEAVRASQLESQLMRARLETLRAQLNPHFLFNALNTITMLVRRNANADALRAIVGLSDLLRRALAGRSTLQTPLREEIAFLENYLAIEQLRFRDRLRVDLMTPPETLDAMIPGMLLQPLVENAVRHGVARRPDAGTVQIESAREGDTLVLTVCDDGPGFPEGWDPASSGGIGLTTTRERLERIYDGAARFEARNRAEGGAVVIVRLPFQLATGT